MHIIILPCPHPYLVIFHVMLVLYGNDTAYVGYDVVQIIECLLVVVRFRKIEDREPFQLVVVEHEIFESFPAAHPGDDVRKLSFELILGHDVHLPIDLFVEVVYTDSAIQFPPSSSYNRILQE